MQATTRVPHVLACLEDSATLKRFLCAAFESLLLSHCTVKASWPPSDTALQEQALVHVVQPKFCHFTNEL